MPLGFKHSNRSHSQQLDSPQAQRPLSGPLAQAQPVSASAVNDKAFDPKAPQPQPYAETHNNPEQHYLQTPIDHQSGSGTYQELEARGEVQPVPQSHRHSRFLFHQPHQQQPQSGEVSQGSNPINASQQELRRQLLQNQGYSAGSSSVPATPVQPPEKSKARGFFGKFTSKSQRDKVHQAQQPHQSTLQNLGRSVSKRQSKQPEIRTHQNNSIERLQQSEWQQSQGSSSGTLSSPQDLDKDDYDPYQVREDQVEHHQQQQQYIPPPQLSVRVVHDQHQEPQAQQYQQYQDQQHLQSPQQYSPLQYQQLGQQVSADNSGDVDYDPSTMPSQQSGYQQNINYPGQSAYRQQNPEVVSQTSHESPVDQIDERPPSVHSSRGYQQQQQYPSRTTSIVDPSRPNKAPPQLQQQSSMGPPPQAAGAQGRKSIETSNKNIQASDNRGPPPGYSQGQFPPPPAGAQNVNLQSPLPPIPGQQQQPQTGYRGTQLRQELSGVTEGRSTPPPPENKDNMSEYDKLCKLFFLTVHLGLVACDLVNFLRYTFGFHLLLE